jgi:hypothetical protein
LTAINAERATAGRDALSRANELDAAILRHLRYAAVTGQTTHYDTEGGGAARARKAGYNYDLTIGVGQIQSFGQRTAAATVAYWMRTSNDRARILDAAYTECGVAYVYAPKNPYTYLWGVLFATPGAPLPEVEDDPDPAERAAKDSDAALERITLPTIETFEPDKLGAAAAELARAAQRVRVAETAVSKLRVEDWSRTQRLNELNALKTNTAAPVDAWCCRYIDDIPINAELWVAEVPGFPMPEATPRTVTMGTYSQTTPRTVAYSERSINILPPQEDDFGTLHPVNNMTPSQAFLAAAMEPGVIRWKPLFRYAVIQAITGTTCTIKPLAGRVVNCLAVLVNAAHHHKLPFRDALISHPGHLFSPFLNLPVLPTGGLLPLVFSHQPSYPTFQWTPEILRRNPYRAPDSLQTP